MYYHATNLSHFNIFAFDFLFTENFRQYSMKFPRYTIYIENK